MQIMSALQEKQTIYRACRKFWRRLSLLAFLVAIIILKNIEVAAANSAFCLRPADAATRFYLYKDHRHPSNSPLIPLTMPASATEHALVSYRTNGGILGCDGQGSAARAEFLFRKKVFDAENGTYLDFDYPFDFMVLALATNDGFGIYPGACIDLSRARSLSLCIRSEFNYPDVQVQVKAFTTQSGGYGDTGDTLAMRPFSVGTAWKRIDIPIEDRNLYRVVTPIVIVVLNPNHRERLVFYIDDVYYALGPP